MLAQSFQPQNEACNMPARTITDQSLFQDVMGQWPQLKTYNHGTALFKLGDEISRESVIRDLENACAKIVAKIPWLTQRLIHEGVTPENSGTFKLVPWPSDLPPNSLLRVRDCSDLCPSYEEFSKAQAPVQWLDPKVICPVPGFPETYDESKIGPAPACLIQINFIKGGALLTFCNQHNVMDGTGIFQVVRLLSIVMNGKEIPPSAVEEGNRNRATVVPLYRSDEPLRNHSHLRAFPSPLTPQAQPVTAKWAQVRFLKMSLPQIKAIATDPVGYDSSVPFISSGDAVSALYWKCLAKTRVSSGHDASSTSKFSRAIDSRGALGVSPEYMGQMVYSSATWLTYQELIDLPLSAIASRLRKNLNEDNNEFSVRSYATYIAGVPDKRTLAYTGPFDRTTDISSSSMAQAALVLKFGILGTPEYIRRPNFLPVPGALYFYPPEASGDLNLLMCLNDYEMDALKTDPTWGPCMEFIG